VSARADDLDTLLELGLGIHRRLNEQRVKERHGRVERRDVSFWYLANRLGRRFLRSATSLLGSLELLGAGVWRLGHLHRSLVLVSGQDVPVDRDSLPVHLLAQEPEEQQRAVARVLGKNLDLLPLYGAWLASAHPGISTKVKTCVHKPRCGKCWYVARSCRCSPRIRSLSWRFTRRIGLSWRPDNARRSQRGSRVGRIKRNSLAASASV
jgi:hypothetical protein